MNCRSVSLPIVMGCNVGRCGKRSRRRVYPVRPRPAIDPWVTVIDAWFIADKDAPRKQRHTVLVLRHARRAYLPRPLLPRDERRSGGFVQGARRSVDVRARHSVMTWRSRRGRVPHHFLADLGGPTR
jgi:hypothetical protein